MSTPPNVYIGNYQRKLVASSRDVTINTDFGRQFVRLVTQNVIGRGEGIRYQSIARNTAGTLDSYHNDMMEDAWSEWSEDSNCDLAESDSWIDIQQALMTSICSDGEGFLRFHDDPSSNFTLRLETLDAPAVFSKSDEKV